jgi:cation diffusion facilitator family transporter
METTSREQVSARVRQVLLWLLIANLAVVVAKAVVGWLSGSLSVLSDAAHSLTDACNNIVGIWLIRFAAKPPDPRHPYGHGKVEQLGAFGITAMMLLTAYEIGRESVVRLWHGETSKVEISSLTIGVMVATFLVNIAVVLYERQQGKRLNSVFLIADAQHTLSDVFVTLGVLAGIILVKLGFAWMDAAVAVAVVGAIVWGAFGVVRQAVVELMDTASVDLERLTAAARDFPDVNEVKDVRTRGQGVYGFVEMTIIVCHNDLGRAHAASERIEDRIRTTFNLQNITIHIEPCADLKR